MNNVAHNHLVLSKHSVHIIPAVIISIFIIFGTWYINRLLQKAIIKKGYYYDK